MAGIEGLIVAPGIELDNPSAAINNGNISILTNWNLGAGTTDANGNITLAYRYNGQAPIITFRAENKVEVKASLTDGFFQIANPTAPPLGTVVIDPVSQNYTIQSAYKAFYVDPTNGSLNGYYAISQVNGRYFAGALTAPAPASAFTRGDPAQIRQYAAMYEEYISNATSQAGSGLERSLVTEFNSNFGNTPVAGQPLAPSAPTLAQEQANPSATLPLTNCTSFNTVLTSLNSRRGLTRRIRVRPVDKMPVLLSKSFHHRRRCPY